MTLLDQSPALAPAAPTPANWRCSFLNPFRMGFAPIGSQTTLWSDAVTLNIKQ